MKLLLLFFALTIVLFCNTNKSYAKTYVITQVIEGRLAEAGKAILKEAYKRIDEEVTFEFLPGERALLMSDGGRADGEMFRVDNLQENYPNLLKVPTSYIEAENVVFTKTLDIHITGYESLKPYIIGFRRGLKTAEFGTEGFSNRQLVTKGEQAFLMLNMGRVDVVIEERLRGWRYVKSLGLKGVIVLEEPVSRVPLFHYLHKKNQSILPKLDEAIQTMHEDGTLDIILQKVLGSD